MCFMRSQDRVAVVVAGEARQDWESYEVESDLMTPADCWTVTLGLKNGVLPPKAAAGAECEIRVGGDRAMVGRVDEINHTVSKRGHQLELTGRDQAAVLLDCSAKIFTRRVSTLEEIVAAVVRPLGITKIRIDAETTNLREKVSVEPGDSAWEVLAHAAEANGLWPWFTPDGTLVIGGPDYDSPIVARLVMHRGAAKANNLLELGRDESVAGRFSHVTVLGQKHGTALEKGKRGVYATAEDDGVPWYRPKIIIDHEAGTVAIARSIARKKLADARLQGLTFRATVPGHRITRNHAVSTWEEGQGLKIVDVSNGDPVDDAPKDEPLWEPGQRMWLASDVFGIDAPFFLMARRFRGGLAHGSLTDLILKEDGMWMLDAHPHTRHQRHRMVGKIIDLDAGS